MEKKLESEQPQELHSIVVDEESDCRITLSVDECDIVPTLVSRRVR